MARLKKIYFIPVNTDDKGIMWSLAHELYADIRKEDQQEMWLLNKDTPSYIYRSMEEAQAAYAVRNESMRLLCITGISKGVYRPLNANCVWFLGSNKLEDFKKEFMFHGKRLMYRYLKTVPTHRLCNYISKDNRKALRWIEYMGAVFVAEDVLGKRGGRFKLFLITEKE